MTSESRQTIGYVVKMFPRLSETFIRNEILELERQGLDLHIFSLKRPTAADLKLVDGQVRSPITYLPERVCREPFRVLRAHLAVFSRYPRGYRRLLRHVLRGREIASLPRGLRRFCQTCCLVYEMKGIRHLHAHFANDPTRVASWARMICRASYSVTTHAKDLYLEARLGSAGLRNKLGLARFVITNSDYSKAGLSASFEGDVPTKIITIYNSIDLAAFPKRKQEPLQPTILSAGRLVEKKGFQDLLAACRILKDRGVKFACEIVGSGELKEALHAAIERFDLVREVRLHGQMSQTELRNRLNAALIFALPCVVASNGDRDILPNVLKEAMAVGVPVVTTRLEGIEELLTHEESGMLVPPGDPGALAATLQRLLVDGDLRRRLSAQARKVIEDRFDLKTNFTRLRDLLFETVRQEDPVPDNILRKESEPDAHSVYNG